MKDKSDITQKNIGWQDVKPLRGHQLTDVPLKDKSRWRVLYLYVITSLIFAFLFIGLINLQVVQGHENSRRSQQNRLEEHVIQPDRGVIYDRNGKKVVTNVPSFDVILNPQELSEEDIENSLNFVAEVVETKESELKDKYKEAIEVDPMTERVLLAQDVDRDQVLKIRAATDNVHGVWIDYSSKRKYPEKEILSHILGYTGEASPEFIEENEDVDVGDIVGKDGVEYHYDKDLRGEKGVRILEINASQNIVAEYVNEGSEPVPGKSLYLTIDLEAQKKLYEVLRDGVEEYDATGAAAVIQDVNTGEIWAAGSVPSYDNNLFIGGISSKDYKKLIEDEKYPLLNRFISAQEPPGSMFKTLVAASALQEGSITPSTVFVSTGVIYLGGGQPFQEYHKIARGPLDLRGGIAKSSNIYFCKTMLELGIDSFIPYAEFFGVGSPTGVDLPGEASGRLPSPENKIELAEIYPWLDAVWYPEGDSCNTAIGQGITVATPIQVANWAAIIANGGKVVEPHFGKQLVLEEDGDEEIEAIETEIVRQGKISDSNLAHVRDGMRHSVSGPLRVIVPLDGAKVAVAAKTGTAEYGVQDESGIYTQTHAWVMGFYPYEDPQYSFVFFLEGGGESNNSASLAREFIDWFAEEKM
jgi:penicillin-binding protein 2